jgi:branched-chain amino acid transport system substrate-binding protein
MRERSLAACAVVAAGLVVALPEAVARLAPGTPAVAEPGVTPTQLVLGGDAPEGSPVARGLVSYLRWVNARGGVHGRRIVYRAGAAPDGVLALAGAAELVDDPSVPQLFADVGASPRSPLATAFGPIAAVEGRVYGTFVARTRPKARVALVVEGYDGAALAAAFRRGLRGSGARVGATPDAADVVAVFTSAELAGETLATLRGRPLVLLSASAAAAPDVPDGAITFGVVKAPTDPRWADDPGLARYRAILRRHARGADPRDAGHVRGAAIGHAVVQVLRAAGPEPTRADVAADARTVRGAANPFLLPGVVVATGRDDGVAVEQGRLLRRSGGAWIGLGGLWGS